MRTYGTPVAYQTALDGKIREQARAQGVNMARLRQTLIFQLFLRRIFAEFGEQVVLKGGMVLELRLTRARTTKDIDLRFAGDPSGILDRLRRAGRPGLDDYLSFEIHPDTDHPIMEGDGVVYDGYRFKATASLAGRRYGDPFGIDVGIGDAMQTPPDIQEGTAFFEFIGIEAPKFRIYPTDVHIAEKLHAYTLPRERPNSRMKDLPDLGLLATTGKMRGLVVRRALTATFSFRGTHDLPLELSAPPRSWEAAYNRAAQLDRLPWPSLDDLFISVAGFLNPILRGDDGMWDPISWSWTAREEEHT